MLIFPLLQTQRLKLRKIDIDDIPSLLKYGNNPTISKYVLNIPYPYTEPDAVFRISYVVQGFNKKTRFVFSIVLKESQEFIGEISLHLMGDGKSAQLAYWLGEPLWNRGIISEAIDAIATFGFDKLNLTLIFAECHIENIGSQKVLEKNGFATSQAKGNVILFKKEKN
jgi:[ribosomal protein S5]-alanine N-acetyltransferase